jgi:hypothetical protein
VALVATLLTLISASVFAQEEPNSGQEALRAWLETEGAPPTKATSVAAGDSEVFTASDDFEPSEGAQTLPAKPAIQTIAAESLILEAVIVPVDTTDTKGKVAMVDYNGHDYELKVGTKIGLKNGYVKEITESYIVIEEEQVSDSGEKSPKEIVLRLP